MSMWIAAAVLRGQGETFKTDAEGFFRNWLVLAPIAMEQEGNGAEEIDRQQLKDEGKIKPKEGDKATVAGGKELVWKKYKSPDYIVDFNVFLGKTGDDKAEDVVGYLVAYVISDEELAGIKIHMGSNDQGKVYVNGKEAVKFTEGRTLEPGDKSQDFSTGENVTLHRGANAIVFKVINEKNNWRGALRFLDRNGAPIVKPLLVTLAP